MQQQHATTQLHVHQAAARHTVRGAYVTDTLQVLHPNPVCFAHMHTPLVIAPQAPHLLALEVEPCEPPQVLAAHRLVHSGTTLDALTVVVGNLYTAQQETTHSLACCTPIVLLGGTSPDAAQSAARLWKAAREACVASQLVVWVGLHQNLNGCMAIWL